MYTGANLVVGYSILLRLLIPTFRRLKYKFEISFGFSVRLYKKDKKEGKPCYDLETHGRR